MGNKTLIFKVCTPVPMAIDGSPLSSALYYTTLYYTALPCPALLYYLSPGSPSTYHIRNTCHRTRKLTHLPKAVPTGLPEPGKHLVVEDRPFDLSSAAAPEGGLLVANLYASYDPYLRGRMRDASVQSYAPAFELNGPVINTTVARVLKSAHPDYREGEIVKAFLPVAEYGLVDKAGMERVQRIENKTGLDLDLGMFLGPLGMPGLTAYAGLLKIGQPKKGETLFVSSAAGAVGQVAGQVAKQLGLRVIGSVGSDAKLDFIIKELGFDGGFNYKKESAADALPRLAPQGIDIYFENVGGEQLDAALENMNTGGRIPVCGMVSMALHSSLRFLFCFSFIFWVLDWRGFLQLI